jgi:hypothetical protein
MVNLKKKGWNLEVGLSLRIIGMMGNQAGEICTVNLKKKQWNLEVLNMIHNISLYLYAIIFNFEE